MDDERTAAGVVPAGEVTAARWYERLWRAPGRAVVAALVALIELYRRWISPATLPRCRFTPSCSAYAVASLKKHGAARGVLKTLWRLARCHPLCKGGYDPP